MRVGERIGLVMDFITVNRCSLSEEDKTLSNAEIKSNKQFLGWVDCFQMVSEEEVLRQIGCFRWCSS